MLFESPYDNDRICSYTVVKARRYAGTPETVVHMDTETLVRTIYGTCPHEAHCYY